MARPPRPPPARPRVSLGLHSPHQQQTLVTVVRVVTARHLPHATAVPSSMWSPSPVTPLVNCLVVRYPPCIASCSACWSGWAVTCVNHQQLVSSQFPPDLTATCASPLECPSAALPPLFATVDQHAATSGVDVAAASGKRKQAPAVNCANGCTSSEAACANGDQLCSERSTGTL